MKTGNWASAGTDVHIGGRSKRPRGHFAVVQGAHQCGGRPSCVHRCPCNLVSVTVSSHPGAIPWSFKGAHQCGHRCQFGPSCVHRCPCWWAFQATSGPSRGRPERPPMWGSTILCASMSTLVGVSNDPGAISWASKNAHQYGHRCQFGPSCVHRCPCMMLVGVPRDLGATP
jgi:hypothetical protein